MKKSMRRLVIWGFVSALLLALVRNAIAENELPCAFERTNVPLEIVLLKDAQDMEDLHRRYTAGRAFI